MNVLESRSLALYSDGHSFNTWYNCISCFVFHCNRAFNSWTSTPWTSTRRNTSNCTSASPVGEIDHKLLLYYTIWLLSVFKNTLHTSNSIQLFSEGLFIVHCWLESTKVCLTECERVICIAMAYNVLIFQPNPAMSCQEDLLQHAYGTSHMHTASIDLWA